MVKCYEQSIWNGKQSNDAWMTICTKHWLYLLTKAIQKKVRWYQSRQQINKNIRLPWWSCWSGIHLPMQRTWVWLQVWEYPTCCRTTKHVPRNYWAQELLILKSAHTRAHVIQLLKPADPRVHPVQADSSHFLKLEKAHMQW